MEARFCDAFPGMYRRADWPTSDHVIPWRYFVLLYDQIPQLRARRQLEFIEAVALGAGLVMAGSDSSLQVALRRLEREAAGG